MKRVYFAGKVKIGGFRQQLMGDCIMSKGNGTIVTINGGDLIYGGCDALDNKEEQDCNEYGRNESHLLTTPDEDQNWIFNSNDDSLNMKSRRHFESALSPQDVVTRCFRQIDDCDAVYAYIDAPDCYGTLVELGYANAKGKPIYLVFNVEKITNTIGDYEDTCVESSGHNGGAFLSDCYLINNTFVPKPYSCYYSPENIFVQDIFINGLTHIISFFAKLNHYVDKSEFKFIRNYEDIFFNTSFLEEFFYKNPKYSVKDLLVDIENIHHRNFFNEEKITWVKEEMNLAWYFYLAIYGSYIHSISNTDKCCLDREDGDYVIDFFYFERSLYKQFWFVRNLDTVKQIYIHKSNELIPFPSELLYFEPKYSVKDILTKLNRTTVNEDDLRELGLTISTEYKKRTGQKPHKINSENKGVSVSVNKYTEKDVEWIADILKKQTKPNYKKYLGSLLAELNHLLDLAEKEKSIDNIVSALQKTLLEYQDIVIT